MKGAGFNVVRMGDLSWDSFEPSRGTFQFEWFDNILEKMHENGIGVILDIPGSPAPIWLHRAFPGIDIVAENGNRLPPAERYMDDISDPDYVREARSLAETILKRYAHNPAVIAVGYDNEIGNGYMSYSEADRLRFIEWLRTKYGTVENLNRAWASEWWSRRLNRFEDVDLPLANGPGPSERYLDLRRYWSDVTVARLEELDAIRKQVAPHLPTISNLWDTAPRRGFDYLGSYKNYVSYGAEGFYPSDPVSGALGALLVKGDLATPLWFNEFTAGGGGFYGTPGRSRMYAYVGLTIGAQGFLAWTFNSHLGGEEQALFGLIDHDNRPSWKLDEWSRIAREFSVLSKYGFPRYTHPEVAIAYSFDSLVDSHPNGPSNTTLQYFKRAYTDQIQGTFEPLFRANVDTAFIHIGRDSLASYKLVIVPADYLMDSASASAIRNYVAGGGTVVMTAFSAKVDEHGQWFHTPLPGGLTDVFGLTTNAFYTADQNLEFSWNNAGVQSDAREYELLEPETASVLATFSNIPGRPAAVSLNRFGKGKAIYVATDSRKSVMAPVLKTIMADAGVSAGPATPEGVYARVVAGRTLYTNTTTIEQRIPITGSRQGILSGRQFEGEIVLAPWDADLFEEAGAR